MTCDETNYTLRCHFDIQVLMRSKILDAHVYLMRRWVLDFLDAKKTKATLKGEFIPYLLAKQFSAHSKKGNSSDAGGDQPQVCPCNLVLLVEKCWW